MNINKKNLVNTYKLISLENRHPSGEITYPLGQDATGMLNYTSDNFYSIHLMVKKPCHHNKGELFSGTPEEIIRSYKNYFSYAGTYNIIADTVIHHVLYSSLPNWINTEQKRKIEMENGFLKLSAKNLCINHNLVDAYVIWEVINNPQKIL